MYITFKHVTTSVCDIPEAAPAFSGAAAFVAGGAMLYYYTITILYYTILYYTILYYDMVRGRRPAFPEPSLAGVFDTVLWSCDTI